MANLEDLEKLRNSSFENLKKLNNLMTEALDIVTVRNAASGTFEGLNHLAVAQNEMLTLYGSLGSIIECEKLATKSET